MARTYFTESQRIDQTGIKLFMATLAGITFIPFLTVDWGPPIPVAEAMTLMGLIFAMIFTGIMMFGMTFETKVTNEGIYYKYPPIIWKWKLASFQDLQQVQLKKYLLWSQYGGPGYKSRPFGKGKAIVIKGDRGVQLTFKTGKILMLGTQKPHEMELALRKAQQVDQDNG